MRTPAEIRGPSQLARGIVSAEAGAIAQAVGLDYVENACTMVVHLLSLR